MAINEINSAGDLIAKRAAEGCSTEPAKPSPFKMKSDVPGTMSGKQQKEEYHVLLQLLLHLIHLVCKLNKTDEQLLQFYQIVHQCISKNPTGNHGKTLLHLAADKATSTICDEAYSNFPNEQVVELLLKCGANVDATDDNHNTALHIVVDIMKCDCCDAVLCNTVRNIITTLLNYDAHIDIRNKMGNIVIGRLDHTTWTSMIGVDPFDHISLKCLAARIVKQSNIPHDDIPDSLVPFIAIH